MQSVNSFIKLLGENYYLDFITDPYQEDLDYDKHYLLVKYNNVNYYELNLELIKVKQTEIVNSFKSLFANSLSEIFIEVANKDAKNIESFLNFYIEAVRIKLNSIKEDFYVDSIKSRYNSQLIDDYQTVHIENLRFRKGYYTDIEIKNDQILGYINRIERNSYDFYNDEETSLYNIEIHCNRLKLLSFLPFQLFHIGHKFIIEINKIKSMNIEEIKGNNFNLQSQSKIEDTYFGKFCEIIDDYTILKKSTVIGVMVDLVDCIKKIKSETLLELQNKGSNRNDYLDYLINEIEKQNYSKDIDISYIQKWLDEYEISIEEIFEMNYRNNNIDAVIDRHYNDMEKFSHEKDKAFLVQSDFYYYFCKYYSDELITYFNSKKENKHSNISNKLQPPMKQFKDEYLNVFCKELSDERIIKETCFDLVYDGIVHYIPYLETEVIENLLLLGNDKREDYLNFAIDKIKKTPHVGNDKIDIDKWLKKYNVAIDKFPKFSNDELNHWLKRYYNGYSETPEDLDFILDIQIDFYCYAAMIEGNKMIEFLESKRANANKISSKIENNETEIAKQLTVNQAIILLDKLGVFSNNILESSPNTKKALLMSLLLGKNVKNIKTSLESLDKKTSVLGVGYQKDIDKIEQLLDNLE
jgi:hypothetical protein